MHPAITEMIPCCIALIFLRAPKHMYNIVVSVLVKQGQKKLLLYCIE